mgnify:CR=1 FL=1
MFPSILLKRAELIGINLFISRSAIFLLKNTTAPFSDFFKSLLTRSPWEDKTNQINACSFLLHKVYSERKKENTYLHELLLEYIYHDFDMDWDDTHFFDAGIFFP